MDFTIDQLLREAVEEGASDLHLQVSKPPMYRVDGDLKPMPGKTEIDEESMAKLLDTILTGDLKKRYYEEKAVDFSHRVPGVARFRCALFIQQQVMGAVFRQIPEKIPNLADLGAPAALLDFARQPRGLVLVTGPTGSGKSTTLAAVLDVINTERHEHILTVEDPIEFVHTSKRCLVNQREIGRDTPSFPRSLRDALRQDPDVILVGEMRDLETISTAITAAETGHLVFGTLHTSSAPSSIDRIIDAFPSAQQQQIRVMLASSLVGIVTQTLLPRADGKGRVAAHEVLVVNNPVRAHIRHQQIEQIRSTMQTGFKVGMQTMDRALVYLVLQGLVAEDLARNRAQSQDEFDHLLKSVKKGGDLSPPRIVQAHEINVEMNEQPPTGPQPGTPMPPQPGAAPMPPQPTAPQPGSPQPPQSTAPQPMPPQPSATPMPPATPQPPAPDAVPMEGVSMGDSPQPQPQPPNFE